MLVFQDTWKARISSNTLTTPSKKHPGWSNCKANKHFTELPNAAILTTKVIQGSLRTLECQGDLIPYRIGEGWRSGLDTSFILRLHFPWCILAAVNF